MRERRGGAENQKRKNCEWGWGGGDGGSRGGEAKDGGSS